MQRPGPQKLLWTLSFYPTNSALAFVQVRACILWVHPQSRVVRLSLRPIFLQPGRPLSRLSWQHLGAVLDDVPVQGFFIKAGATFTLKDGALAFARVSMSLSFSGSTWVCFCFLPFLVLVVPECATLFIAVRMIFALLECLRTDLLMVMPD